MKVVFYSDKCEYCKKLLAYLDKYNIKNIFKLVNIDVTEAPKDIDIVPTIIDTELNQPLKGKKAFEYLLNIKYFNNPTNNIDYVKDLPPNPDIKEDDKAVKSKTINLEIDNSNTSNTSNTTNVSNTNENSLNDLFKENESLALYEAAKNENKSVESIAQEMNKLRNGQDAKLSILLQMKAKKK